MQAPRVARDAYLDYAKPFIQSLRENYRYSAANFWDHWHFNNDNTIDRNGIAPVTQQLHYAVIDSLLMEALADQGINPAEQQVLDVGTGRGRFMAFWEEFEAETVHGMDISEQAVADLGDGAFHDDIRDMTTFDPESYGLVSAIGVLFHVVHDESFMDALENIHMVLKPGGYGLITAEFGWWTRKRQFQDRQDSQPAECFKKVRSRRDWKVGLDNAGLELVKVYKPRKTAVRLPENTLLVVRRPGE